MARACDFDHVAMSSLGVPSFKVRVDGFIFCRYHHPTWFASPRSRGDDCFEIARRVEYLRSRHEVGLLYRKIRCKVLMELRGVEVRKTICRLLYRARLAEVTREALAIVGFVLSSVWHVRRNVH
jgi:hypothetical protein